MLGVLPAEGRDLIIAGAILSITLNPLAFNLVDAVLARIEIDKPRASWASKFGAARFSGLYAELLKTRQRAEAREAKRGLQVKGLVKSFPIFAELDSEQLQELLFLFRPRSASPGERLVRLGDRADLMFFISSGAVEVTVLDEKIRLGPGDFFGEMALLNRSRRTADVTAIEYCQFLTLDQVEFRNFVSSHPHVRAQIDHLAAERAEMNKRRIDSQTKATSEVPAPSEADRHQS